MTVPTEAAEPASGPDDGAPAVPFPLGWVLRQGSAAVRYRALVDAARIDVAPADARTLVHSLPAVIELAVTQQRDGVWNGAMLAIPDAGDARLTGIGTLPAIHRLLELGVDLDFPALLAARRPLFRLLAEDSDPGFLYDLGEHARDPDRRRFGRLLLREGAAAALARMGHEQDPRLRGCANRMMQRVRDFLESPLAADPWVSAGGKRLLSPEASPPSLSLLRMLASLPRVRQENHGFMQQLQRHLEQPAPQGEVSQAVGGAVLPRPQLVLGDPIGDADPSPANVVSLLFWLELLARLGMLASSVRWTSVLDRLLEGCDRDGVWRPPRGKLPTPALQPERWPWYPLDPRREGDAVAAEVTTRLAIISRLAGREVFVV